jgi:hypothetical protein
MNMKVNYIKKKLIILQILQACRSLRHKLSLTCLFVSSELLFNVLIDSSKYLSFVGLGIQSDLFPTNGPPISPSSSSSFPN